MMAGVHSTSYVHRAALIRCHEKAPARVPSAEEYEAWLATVEKHVADGAVRRMRNIDGAKLRRAILLLRAGYDKTYAARAIGLSSPTPLKRWLAKLPAELAA